MAKRYYKSTRKDSVMISENKSKLANLPTEVIMKEYPKTSSTGDPSLNDTISGIDKQMNSDVKSNSCKKGSSNKF